MKYGVVRMDVEGEKIILRVNPDYESEANYPETPSLAGYLYFKSGITKPKDAALELADFLIKERKAEIDRLTNILTSLEQLRWDIRAGDESNLLSLSKCKDSR